MPPLADYSEELGFPDPRVASARNVQAALRRIIGNEGPLTKRFLFKLYVAGCPTLHRAGKTVKRLLNGVLYSMQKEGEIIIEDELGDRSLESQVVRLAGTPRVRPRAGGGRDLVEIPASEIWLMLERLGSKGAQGEALMRAVLEHYGFSKLTEARRRHLGRVISIWRQRGS